MVWAVDLDDGTLIDALGANLNRPKAEVYEEIFMECDMGTGLRFGEL